MAEIAKIRRTKINLNRSTDLVGLFCLIVDYNSILGRID